MLPFSLATLGILLKTNWFICIWVRRYSKLSTWSLGVAILPTRTLGLYRSGGRLPLTEHSSGIGMAVYAELVHGESDGTAVAAVLKNGLVESQQDEHTGCRRISVHSSLCSHTVWQNQLSFKGKIRNLEVIMLPLHHLKCWSSTALLSLLKQPSLFFFFLL